jgi:predicted AlkP superfamily pyrophosphatase or phosphodiesterase
VGSVLLLAASVVLLSIDGLKPEYVLGADALGLKIPNLRRLVAEGAYATAVEGVTPTVTYPSHTTMLTGVWPQRHRIFSNHPFDPLGKNDDGWYWYFEDVSAPTLWQAAQAAGLVTASVDWPVSVGAPVGYNIVQYWRAGNAEDRKVIRALSTPGLLRWAEAKLGPYPEGNDYSVAADRRRTEFMELILAEMKPAFFTAYLSGLDTESHASGPGSRKALDAVEALDELVGRLRARADVLCLVSDHGFLPSDKELNLNTAIREAGLIEIDEAGAIRDWKAFAWNEGGSAAVFLKDPADAAARDSLRRALSGIAKEPGGGIDRLLEGEEARRLGGSPDAVFIVGLARGFRTGSRLDGPLVRSVPRGGTHGYLPDVSEMASAFFLVGKGIPAGLDLGRIDMRDIAPTLAAILGVSLPEAEGTNLLEKHAKDAPSVHRR